MSMSAIVHNACIYGGKINGDTNQPGESCASRRCEADIYKIWLRNPFVLIAKGRNRLWHRTPTHTKEKF